MPAQLSGYLETDLINMVSSGLQDSPAKKVKRRLSAKKVSYNKEKIQKRGSFSKDKKTELKRKESVDMGFRIRHFIDEVEEKFLPKHKVCNEDGSLHRNNSARLRKLIEKDHPEISRASKKFSLPKASTLPALFGRADTSRSRRGSFRGDSIALAVGNSLDEGRRSPLILLPDISPDTLPVVVVSPSRSRRMSVSSPNRLSPNLGLDLQTSVPRRGSCSPSPRTDSLSVHHSTPDNVPKIRLSRGRSSSMWDVSRFEEETANLRISSGKRARSGRLRQPPEWGPCSGQAGDGLFRENSRSADRKRLPRNRYKTEHGSELDDDDYVAPINRFRKVARLVQLALIFYSGEGKTNRRKDTEKTTEEHHAFFDKPDKMTFLPAFDPSLYKAQRIKEMVVGSDIKDILGKRPEDRTEEEIQQVLFALRTYATFAEYPLNMQERMCRKAHYLKFDASRIILRQGDRAEWFYYVLSGTTAVSILDENKTTGSVNLRNVGYLKRGTAFGELALLHGTRRTATVSCKDAVELIAVDKEDFVQMNQLDSDEEKEHIKYCRTLPILQDWPVNLLNETSGVCNFHFFKKLTVMAKSNHDTPFIYIVKSGHVRVLTKVTKIRQKQSQGCRVRSRTVSTRTPGSGTRSNRSDTSSSCSNGFRSRINSQSTNGAPPTYGSSRHMKGNLVPLISRLNVGEGTFQDVPIQPTFLQVCVLGAGDSFGLSTLVYSEEISCGIVSLGAECIEISKEFFLKNASENYLRKLKATIRPFPSEDKLQQDIQDQKLWNNYKNTVVASVLDPSSI